MLDIKWIRDNPEAFDKALKNRGMEPQAQSIVAFDEDRRKAIQTLQDLQSRRNQVAKQIGDLKRQGINADALMEEASLVRESLASAEEDLRSHEQHFKALFDTLPNMP